MIVRHTPCDLSVMLPFAKNPVQGARAVGPWSYCSLNLARVGSFRLATDGTGPLTRLGDRFKRPAMNSSTTKGAKALASELNRRRCRTVKTCC